jgi:Taurine catabolism dioxygenase TauD, TfdA family
MALGIRQVNPHFAAEIGGIDLSKSVDRPTVDAIWQAIDRYAVLVFRDQRLDDTQLRDFAANFGALEIGRAAARGGRRRLAYPEIGDSSNLDEDGRLRERDDRRRLTALAIGCGIPMLPTCRCRSCWGCFMRSPCHRRTRSVAAKPNSPICAQPMTPSPRR